MQEKGHICDDYITDMDRGFITIKREGSFAKPARRKGMDAPQSHGQTPTAHISSLGEYPRVATGTYNNIITYIQNISYIVIRKCFMIYL